MKKRTFPLMRLFLTSSFGTIILALASLPSFIRAENYPTTGSQEYAILHGATIIKPNDEKRLNIPEDSWENRTDGISIALILKTGGLKDGPKSRIDIYIKNVSGSDKFFLAPNKEIIIFYDDDKAASRPLKKTFNNPILDENIIIPVRPGQILLRTAELTPEELMLVEQYDVKCLFRMGGKDSKEVNIQSAARRLSPSI